MWSYCHTVLDKEGANTAESMNVLITKTHTTVLWAVEPIRVEANGSYYLYQNFFFLFRDWDYLRGGKDSSSLNKISKKNCCFIGQPRY